MRDAAYGDGVPARLGLGVPGVGSWPG
jgi:hypothetical protein